MPDAGLEQTVRRRLDFIAVCVGLSAHAATVGGLPTSMLDELSAIAKELGISVEVVRPTEPKPALSLEEIRALEKEE